MSLKQSPEFFSQLNNFYKKAIQNKDINQIDEMVATIFHIFNPKGKKELENYRNQKFLGKKCTFGDDRHLTYLVLKTHEVVCAEISKALTMAPNNLNMFMTQQKRWMQSFIRENLFTIKYSIKSKKKMLFLDTFISGILPYFSLGIRLLMIYTIIIYPLSIIYYFIQLLL
jgi:hyaluronan synthase